MLKSPFTDDLLMLRRNVLQWDNSLCSRDQDPLPLFSGFVSQSECTLHVRVGTVRARIDAITLGLLSRLES